MTKSAWVDTRRHRVEDLDALVEYLEPRSERKPMRFGAEDLAAMAAAVPALWGYKHALLAITDDALVVSTKLRDRRFELNELAASEFVARADGDVRYRQILRSGDGKNRLDFVMTDTSAAIFEPALATAVANREGGSEPHT